MIDCIAVGAGGFIGAVCRYLIGMIALETADMMKDGKMHLAVIYTVLSATLGVLAVFAGQGIVGTGDMMSNRSRLLLATITCFLSGSAWLWHGLCQQRNLFRNG